MAENGDNPTPTPTGEPLAAKAVFTTGEAAEVCGVSQQTIIRCFDSGRLGGFRVPGSKFRRIPREDLLRFMKTNNIPADALDGPPRPRVLALGKHAATHAAGLTHDTRLEVVVAADAFDAGMLAETFRPTIILMDCGMEGLDASAVARRIRENPAYAGVRVFCLGGPIGELMNARIDAVLPANYPHAELAARIEAILGLEARARPNGQPQADHRA